MASCGPAPMASSSSIRCSTWPGSRRPHITFWSNLFVLRATPSDYFQPAVAISGVIAALGVAPWLSLLLWKPVAVIGTFLAMRAYVYRSIPDRFARRATLTLALLFASFSVIYGSFGIVGDLMPFWLSWGYPFGLMALALIVFALLGYDRARVRRGWRGCPACSAPWPAPAPVAGRAVGGGHRRRRACALARAPLTAQPAPPTGDDAADRAAAAVLRRPRSP